MGSIAGLTGTMAGAMTAAPSTAASGPPARLVSAAHEFEAQMMKELLKPMTGQSGLDGEEDESASGSAGALGDFASEALGRALSAAGGFGIANKIISDLTPHGNQKVTSAVTALHNGDTVMKNLK